MKLLLPSLPLLTTLVLLPLNAMSADPPKTATASQHPVVFQVTSAGSDKWDGALENVANAKKSLGATAGKLIVVLHGKGLGLLLKKTSAEHPELGKKLEALHSEGVVFAACENTMEREKVTRKDLAGLATTVDSGIGEVIRKQGEGYRYIKIGE